MFGTSSLHYQRSERDADSLKMGSLDDSRLEVHVIADESAGTGRYAPRTISQVA